MPAPLIKISLIQRPQFAALWLLSRQLCVVELLRRMWTRWLSSCGRTQGWLQLKYARLSCKANAVRLIKDSPSLSMLVLVSPLMDRKLFTLLELRTTWEFSTSPICITTNIILKDLLRVAVFNRFAADVLMELLQIQPIELVSGAITEAATLHGGALKTHSEEWPPLIPMLT